MQGYIFIGGIAIVIIVCAIINFKRNKKNVYLNGVLEKIEGFLLDLVLDAERIYKSGTGQFKKAYVINLILNGAFYQTLPSFIQRLITFEILSELVDKIVSVVFNKVKDSNKNIQEIIDGTH